MNTAAPHTEPTPANPRKTWPLYQSGPLALAAGTLAIWFLDTPHSALLALLVGGAILALALITLHAQTGPLQSERDTARHDLTAHRDFMRRVLDALPQTIFMKDASSRYVFVNEAFCELRAMSRDEILNGPIAKMLDAQGQGTASESEDIKVFAGHNVLKEEHVFHPDSGKELFRVVSKRLLHDDQGTPLIVGATQNVSLWRKAEREARALSEEQGRQRHFLKFILNTLPFPVYVKDDALRYILVNKAFVALTGKTETELLTRTANEVSPSDTSLMDEMDDAALIAQPSMQVKECTSELIDAHGKPRQLLSRKIAGRDADGSQVIVGTYTALRTHSNEAHA